jgi:hypothetical protein
MENPAILGFVFLSPMWLVFFLGVIVGWLWKPKWATSLVNSFDFASQSLGSPLKFYSSSSSPSVNSSITMQTPNPDSLLINKEVNKKGSSSSSSPTKFHSSTRYFNIN